MGDFSEELLDKIFAGIDCNDKAGRLSLRTCRFVSHKFKRVVHPYAFRVVNLNAVSQDQSSPFSLFSRFASDPANSSVAAAVQKLFITGYNTLDSDMAGRPAVLSWSILWSMIQYLPALREITIKGVPWDLEADTADAEKTNHEAQHVLPSILPHLYRLNLDGFAFAIPMHSSYPTLPTSCLPTVLYSPSITELHIRHSNFFPWSRPLHRPWSCGKIAVDDPQEDFMQALRDVEHITHLELWDLFDSQYTYILMDVVEKNKHTLKALLLDIDLYGNSK